MILPAVCYIYSYVIKSPVTNFPHILIAFVIIAVCKTNWFKLYNCLILCDGCQVPSFIWLPFILPTCWGHHHHKCSQSPLSSLSWFRPLNPMPVSARERVLREWHRLEKPSIALRPRRFFYHSTSAMASPSISKWRACPCLCTVADYTTLEQDPSLFQIINPPLTRDQGNPLTREFSADSSIIIQGKASAIVPHSKDRNNWACASTEQRSTVALRYDDHF